MYEISPKLIKIAAERIIKHLLLIFNCRIEQGIFPEKLKVAFIYPIHKGKSISLIAQTINLFLFCHYLVKYMKN